LQIEVAALRTSRAWANASSAHLIDSRTRAIGTRVFQIRGGQRDSRAAAVDSREQQSRSALQYFQWRAAQ
jgi:hypothetical protein